MKHAGKRPVRARRRPTNLHVSHSWGGGLGQWVRLFSSNDPYSWNIVLTSVGTLNAYALSVEVREGNTGETIESHTLQRPICESAVTNEYYREVLRSVVDRFRVDHVYISSFIGHTLDVLDVGCPTTLVYHDYFPFCQGLNAHFFDLCTACTPDRHADCLGRNPLSFLFRQNTPEYWRGYREAYFSRLSGNDNLTHVSPSVNLVHNIKQLDRTFHDLDFKIIPHGIDYDREDCFGGASDGRHLRLVVLGYLNLFKGFDQFRRLFPYLRLSCEIHILGSGENGCEFDQRSRANVVTHYEPGELSSLMKAIRPDVALFLSTVPETYSYTLSEVFAHGIPACAVDLGSFTERIVEGESGWLFAPQDDEAVVRLLERLDQDRSRLRHAAARLESLPLRGASEMIEDYYRLRGDMTARIQGHLNAPLSVDYAPRR